MAKCKWCGTAFRYSDFVGYASDLCSAFCDGAYSQNAKIRELEAEVERMKTPDPLLNFIAELLGMLTQAQREQLPEYVAVLLGDRVGDIISKAAAYGIAKASELLETRPGGSDGNV